MPSAKVFRKKPLFCCLGASLIFTPFCTEATVKRPAASSTPAPSPLREAQKHPTLEAKAGYFFFGNSTLRKVYNHGGLDLQLSSAYLFKKYLQVYGSLEFMQKNGRSLNSQQKSWFWAVPVSVGLRPIFTIASFAQFYFTAGPRYVYAHIHNKSSFVDKNLSYNAIGGFGNVGFNFFPLRHMVLDCFAEYSYVPAHFHPSKDNVFGRSKQIGGYTFGAGVGYVF